MVKIIVKIYYQGPVGLTKFLSQCFIRTSSSIEKIFGTSEEKELLTTVKNIFLLGMRCLPEQAQQPENELCFRESYIMNKDRVLELHFWAGPTIPIMSVL